MTKSHESACVRRTAYVQDLTYSSKVRQKLTPKSYVRQLTKP